LRHRNQLRRGLKAVGSAAPLTAAERLGLDPWAAPPYPPAAGRVWGLSFGARGSPVGPEGKEKRVAAFGARGLRTRHDPARRFRDARRPPCAPDENGSVDQDVVPIVGHDVRHSPSACASGSTETSVPTCAGHQAETKFGHGSLIYEYLVMHFSRRRVHGVCFLC